MRKLLAILLVIAMSISIFSACNKAKTVDDSPTPDISTPQQETEPEKETVVLRTVSMFGGTDPSAADYQQLISNFMKENPHILITDESATVDETWKARVTTDFSSGNDPDVVFYFTGADAVQLIETGKVVSIEEIREEYPDYASNITDAAMSFMKEFDGKHYAVPIRGFYEGLFCNTDLFEKYGLDLPTDWEKLEAAVKKFSAEGIVPIAASFSDVPHYWIEHFILAVGGYEDHKINPKDTYPESWAEGLKLFKTFKDMGAFPVDVNATKNDITTNMFYDKQAAMILDGSWIVGGIKDPDTTTVLPVPCAPGGKKDPSDIIGGFSSGFYISKKAWDDPARRDAAVKFVQYMTSNEAIAMFAKVAGAPAADVPTPEGLTAVMEAGIKMGGQAKNIDMPIDSRLSKEAWTYLVSMIGSIADGQVTPEEVLQEVVNKNK